MSASSKRLALAKAIATNTRVLRMDGQLRDLGKHAREGNVEGKIIGTSVFRIILAMFFSHNDSISGLHSSLMLHFNLEDGSDKLSRNVGNQLPTYTASGVPRNFVREVFNKFG